MGRVVIHMFSLLLPAVLALASCLAARAQVLVPVMPITQKEYKRLKKMWP